MKNVLIIFLLFLAFPAQAAIVNEIAWMGTDEQWQNEWLELYNESDKEISLDGWTLKAEDGSPFIELEGIIKAKSYFLLERTDDTTVPNIAADQIYTGGLANDGEKLMLLRNNEAVEEIDCSLGWFGGDNITKKTMERVSPESDPSDPLSWKTSSKKGGTPRAENSEEKEIPQRQIASLDESEEKSDFSAFPGVLLPGIGLSLLASALATSFFLKIKRKNIKI